MATRPSWIRWGYPAEVDEGVRRDGVWIEESSRVEVLGLGDLARDTTLWWTQGTEDASGMHQVDYGQTLGW